MHGIALLILNSVLQEKFSPANPAEVAKRSYDYLQSNCRNSRSILLAENLYGVFLMNTRDAKAIKHIELALQLSEKKSFDSFLNHLNLADIYSFMGMHTNAADHLFYAIEEGDEYFSKERRYEYSLDEKRENLIFTRGLLAYINILASNGEKPENLILMKEQWIKIEKILAKWGNKDTQFGRYLEAVEPFSSVGDFSYSHVLLEKAVELNRKYPHANKERAAIVFQLTEALLLFREGNHDMSADLLLNSLKKLETEIAPNMSQYGTAGYIFEGAGRLGPAIKNLEAFVRLHEEARQTFEVGKRGRILDSDSKKYYWALVRAYASQYVEQGLEKDFQGALKVARLLKGRQFGEILGLEYQINDFTNIQSLKLQPDELLINIVDTGKALVVFYVDRERHELAIVPVSGEYSEAVLRIREGLSNAHNFDDIIDDIKSVSKIILFPVMNRLDKYPKIIVVPDGVLTGIPFTILSKSIDIYKPLLLDHELLSMPSISYLIETRQGTKQIDNDKMLAIADPKFNYLDNGDSLITESEKQYKRAVNNLGLFTPLPETRTEIENISKYFEPKNVTFVLGEQAKESNVKKMTLSEFRYLHFATHGILSGQIPNIFEPALVLASENDDSEEDGFLTTREVAQLKLNSEITVLSACDTGSGEYYSGEGVMGLNRAFLLAGSKSVLVSLWPVESQATVALMTDFYRHLRSGKSKAESLRLAQLSMMSGSVTSETNQRSIKLVHGSRHQGIAAHPYYWAPFIMVGE